MGDLLEAGMEIMRKHGLNQIKNNTFSVTYSEDSGYTISGCCAIAAMAIGATGELPDPSYSYPYKTGKALELISDKCPTIDKIPDWAATEGWVSTVNGFPYSWGTIVFMMNDGRRLGHIIDPRSLEEILKFLRDHEAIQNSSEDAHHADG